VFVFIVFVVEIKPSAPLARRHASFKYLIITNPPHHTQTTIGIWFKEGLVAWDQTITPWLKE
jgi:hypothetical protein